MISLHSSPVTIDACADVHTDTLPREIDDSPVPPTERTDAGSCSGSTHHTQHLASFTSVDLPLQHGSVDPEGSETISLGSIASGVDDGDPERHTYDPRFESILEFP